MPLVSGPAQLQYTLFFFLFAKRSSLASLPPDSELYVM